MHVGIGEPDAHPEDSENRSSHQDSVTALGPAGGHSAEMAHIGKCLNHWPLVDKRGSQCFKHVCLALGLTIWAFSGSVPGTWTSVTWDKIKQQLKNIGSQDQGSDLTHRLVSDVPKENPGLTTT